MGWFSAENHFPVDRRTVLITGGSQGLGESTARLLAQKGANVIIVARDVNKLRVALNSISAAALYPSAQRFHYISADLADPSSATRILTEATQWNNSQPPDIIWCCAGSSIPGLFIDTPLQIHKQQIDVNYFSAVSIAHAALRTWLSGPLPAHPQPAKHLIFTSSVVAFYPIAGYSAYSPGKAALRVLSDSLSQELALYPPPHPQIKPHTLFPATISSPSLPAENAIKPGITKKLEEGDEAQTPDECAAICVQALERGEELVTTSWLGWAMKVGMLGASRRNGWGVLDTVGAAIVAYVFPWVRRDMDGTVRTWGEKNWSEGRMKASENGSRVRL